jgi:hypothetical protein
MRRIISICAGILAGIIVVTGVTWSVAKASQVDSGVPTGGMLLSFRPRHVSGPDKGKCVCPICQYPTNPAVQVWVNGDDESNVAAIATTLDKACAASHDKKLKAFVVYVNATHETNKTLDKRLEEMAATSKMKNVALTYVTSADMMAVRDNEINVDPRVKNTVFVYKARKVSTKFVNLVADKPGLEALETAVTQIVK